MTKEQFIKRWSFKNDLFRTDLDVVIATEIAKVQEVNEINKNLYFHKQVMNPYETGSQSYTAYEKGFEEGYNKSQEILKEKAKEQPELNPIAAAYYAYNPIRYINWNPTSWIKMHSKGHSIDEKGKIYKNNFIQFNFDDNPQDWEIYKENQTEPTEKKIDPTDENWNKWQLTQQPAKPFDRERFEAMFCIFALRGDYLNFEQIKNSTEQALAQLDAYYASKEGGNNG